MEEQNQPNQTLQQPNLIKQKHRYILPILFSFSFIFVIFFVAQIVIAAAILAFNSLFPPFVILTLFGLTPLLFFQIAFGISIFNKAKNSEVLSKKVANATKLLIFANILIPLFIYFLLPDISYKSTQNTETNKSVITIPSPTPEPTKEPLPTPFLSCTPRPACLDAETPCLMPESADMCPRVVSPGACPTAPTCKKSERLMIGDPAPDNPIQCAFYACN